jgi:hypothetical protein
MNIKEQTLCLEIGSPVFDLFVSKIDRAIIASWKAQTEVNNVLWMRLIVIRLGWPPIRCITCFTTIEL